MEGVGRRKVAHLAAFTGVAQHEDIQIAIVIIVRRCGGITHAQTGEALPQGELALAVIFHDQESRAGGHRQILVTIIIKINQQRAGGIVKKINPGRSRNIGQGAIRFVAEEEIRQAARLTQIEILEAIPIHVPDGQAVIPQKVRIQRTFDAFDPVVHAPLELLAPRRRAAQHLAGNVLKHHLRIREFIAHQLRHGKTGQARLPFLIVPCRSRPSGVHHGVGVHPLAIGCLSRGGQPLSRLELPAVFGDPIELEVQGMVLRPWALNQLSAEPFEKGFDFHLHQLYGIHSSRQANF